MEQKPTSRGASFFVFLVFVFNVCINSSTNILNNAFANFNADDAMVPSVGALLMVLVAFARAGSKPKR